MLWSTLACTTLVLFPTEEQVVDSPVQDNPSDSWQDTGAPTELALSPTGNPSLDADWAVTWVGCDSQLSLWVENHQSQSLVVRDLVVDTPSNEFQVDAQTAENGPMPWTLLPGDRRQLLLRYTPVDEKADLLRVDIEVESGGPDLLRLEIWAQGRYFKTHSEPFISSTQADPTLYELAHVPVPITLVVQLDGARLFEGFYWTEGDNTLHLDSAPEAGTVVQVDYAQGTDCPE